MQVLKRIWTWDIRNLILLQGLGLRGSGIYSSRTLPTCYYRFEFMLVLLKNVSKLSNSAVRMQKGRCLQSGCHQSTKRYLATCKSLNTSTTAKFNLDLGQNISFHCQLLYTGTCIFRWFLSHALLSLFIKGFQQGFKLFNRFVFLSSYRPELYQCCLCWRDDVTLLIGWADMVQVENCSHLSSGLKHSFVCSFMWSLIWLFHLFFCLCLCTVCLSVNSHHMVTVLSILRSVL